MPADRERTVPTSTYRVQLSDRFTLDDLAAQVPYMARLGVSHVYLSPIYTARPGSPHGYDIVDYGCINRELGGQAAWRRLVRRVAGPRHGRRPRRRAESHGGRSRAQRALAPGASRGPSSPAARFFDIDWRPLTGLVRDKVLLPILEEPYGQALMKGVVQVERDHGDHQILLRLHLPLPLAHRRWTRSCADDPLDEVVARINRNPHLLHHLLEQQHYRLAYWRPANDEINYRRFFGINELDRDACRRSERCSRAATN